MTSLSRTWVQMSSQSVFRTSTITSLNASRHNSKVLKVTHNLHWSATALTPVKVEIVTSDRLTAVQYILLGNPSGCLVTQIIFRPTPALFLGSSEHVESVMDEVEKYMMTRLYKEVFCPETTDDEKKDLAIQKRIRSANTSQKCLNLSEGKHNNSKHDYSISCCYRALHWVTIEMLCVPVDEEIPEVSDSVVKAITGESSWRLQKDTFSFKNTS